MTTRRTRLLAAGLALAAVAATGACSRANGDTTGPPTSPTPTTPTPTPTRLSQAEKDIKAAEGTVVRFLRTWDQLGQNPELPMSVPLLKVTRDTEYRTWVRQMQYRRVQGWKQQGDTQPLSVTGQASKSRGGRKTIRVNVCSDFSRVDVKDATGKSVVSPDRVPRARAIYWVSRWPDGWFIVDDDTNPVPC